MDRTMGKNHQLFASLLLTIHNVRNQVILQCEIVLINKVCMLASQSTHNLRGYPDAGYISARFPATKFFFSNLFTTNN